MDAGKYRVDLAEMWRPPTKLRRPTHTEIIVSNIGCIYVILSVLDALSPPGESVTEVTWLVYLRRV